MIIGQQGSIVKHGAGVPTCQNILSTYTKMCRGEFRVLEELDRDKKFLREDSVVSYRKKRKGNNEIHKAHPG